jgi:UMF1 family MFS transporter
MRHVFVDKKIFSWALYDWANSAFATTVMAGFFPLFYKQYWSAGVDPSTSTFQLGVANSAASATIVVLAPVLGAIADAGSAKKKFLLAFALLGVAATGALYFVAQGQWWLALGLFMAGIIGFSAANTFYDSLIISVAPEEKLDLVSAYGFALGYLGGGLLFAVDVAMTIWPQAFGLSNATEAVQVSFLTVAVWWLVFSLPLMFNVPEPPGKARVSAAKAVSNGLRQLLHTFREIRKLRIVFLFLIAYWLYIDGVDTIVRMAVDYGMALGFDANNLIVALLITQFVGFPAAVAFGFIGNKIGAKNGILIAIGVYIAATLWAVGMDTVKEFYGLAITIGLVQGGVQSLSRSFYARIIPANKSAEYFGFYNMLGKFAAVLGPLMIGLVSFATGNPRYSILSLLILFIAGGTLLYFVDEKEGARIARELERNENPKG